MDNDTAKLLANLIGSHTDQLRKLSKQQFALVDCMIQTLSALLTIEENIKNDKRISIQEEIDEIKKGLRKFIAAGTDDANE